MPERAQAGQSWGRIGSYGRSGKATLLHSPSKHVLDEKSERHIEGGLHFCKVSAKVKIILSIILTVLSPICHYYAGSFSSL